MSTVEKTISDRVKQVLNNSGLEPDDLAEKFGVNESTVYRWISGDTKNFSKNTLKSIANKLQVDYEWLRYGRGEYSSPPESEFTIDQLVREERLRYGIEDIPDTEQGRALQDALDDAVSVVLRLRRLIEIERRNSEQK